VREIVGRSIRKKVIDLPLIWDGGNLITNGEVGFITDKIFRDNPDQAPGEVCQVIEACLQIKPLIIPSAEFDYLGHADGYISFLSKSEVALAYNPMGNTSGREAELYQELEHIMRVNNFSVVKISDHPSRDKSRSGKDFIYSASGCYVNFLRLNDTLIFPQYTLKKRKGKLDFNALNNQKIAPFTKNLKLINCDGVTRQGGVLRCLSFVN
jgi:agmatine/peptidylarginine deiminase